MKILYKIKSGSHLYGLNTPTSDLDYTGVYVEDNFEDFIDPFNTKDEMDMSIKSKKENGKNDKDAVDEKYFHLKKFIKLCADNNPGFIEMLFAPEDCIEYVDPNFKSLILDHPEMFVNAKLIDRFIGYAKSQEQKSYTKSNNYNLLRELSAGLELFVDCSIYSKELTNSSPVSELFGRPVKMKPYREFNNVIPNINVITVEHSKTNIETIYEIGDMKFPSGVTLKEAYNRIEDRFSRASHRIEGIFINRYEPKFMSHTVRLLDEGYQLLTTGKISFPFTGQALEDIMSIKLGNTPVEDIPELVNKYKERLSELEKVHTLPKTANYEAIKRAYLLLVVSMYNREMAELAEDY